MKSHASQIQKSSLATLTLPRSHSLRMRPFSSSEGHEEDFPSPDWHQARLTDMPVRSPDQRPMQRQTEEEQSEELNLQRQPEEEEETLNLQRQPEDDEDELQIQAKLTIGQPGDRYEQEADQMAAKVMAMPESSVGESSIQHIEKEDDELRAKPQVQAKGAAPAVPAGFENQLAQHKGSGQPLSDETRAFMEPRFGADFSNVQVHETPDLTNAIQAQAFTHGQDVYFNSGKYNPGSSGGKALLAHELTHVVQQEENSPHKELEKNESASTLKKQIQAKSNSKLFRSTGDDSKTSSAKVRTTISMLKEAKVSGKRFITSNVNWKLMSFAFSKIALIKSLADSVDDIDEMRKYGTLLQEVQGKAELIENQSREAASWADKTSELNALLLCSNLILELEKSGDYHTASKLRSIVLSAGDSRMRVSSKFQLLDSRLQARSNSLFELSKVYRSFAKVPQGNTTAPNAEQFGLSESLELLGNTLKNASEKYSRASTLSEYWAGFAFGVSNR